MVTLRTHGMQRVQRKASLARRVAEILGHVEEINEPFGAVGTRENARGLGRCGAWAGNQPAHLLMSKTKPLGHLKSSFDLMLVI